MSTVDYRRRLEPKEVLALAGGAAGAGVALAGVVFYLGRIWLQRVRLKPHERPPLPASATGPDPARLRREPGPGPLEPAGR